MGKIDNFSIQRFQMSLQTLTTFCKDNELNKYYKMIVDPSMSGEVKHCIYKGAFIESIEYIYGFVPEVFKEYCKQFGIEIYSRDGKVNTIGYLDLINSMKSVNKIDSRQDTFFRNVFKSRGKIIHQTLIDSKEYYSKIGQIFYQIWRYDLNDLYKYVVSLCKEINSSYNDGVVGNLVVKDKSELVNDTSASPILVDRITDSRTFGGF